MTGPRSAQGFEAERQRGQRAAVLLRVCLLLGPLILGMLLLLLPVWLLHGRADGLPSCGQSRIVAEASGCDTSPALAFTPN